LFWGSLCGKDFQKIPDTVLSRNTNKIQLCNRINYSKVFLKAQHVSNGTPLIIRSSKLYLQPLVYVLIWWPTVAKFEWAGPTTNTARLSPWYEGKIRGCHCSMWPHAATYCVIIQTQRTQISGRNSNGAKHRRGPPEDGREKSPKHVGVLYLQTCMSLTFYWF
jgi:hypothetical protein